jgi:hypothetical protein
MYSTLPPLVDYTNTTNGRPKIDTAGLGALE